MACWLVPRAIAPRPQRPAGAVSALADVAPVADVANRQHCAGCRGQPPSVSNQTPLARSLLVDIDLAHHQLLTRFSRRKQEVSVNNHH